MHGFDGVLVLNHSETSAFSFLVHNYFGVDDSARQFEHLSKLLFVYFVIKLQTDDEQSS